MDITPIHTAEETQAIVTNRGYRCANLPLYSLKLISIKLVLDYCQE
jgi:hypothetical protein